MDHVVVASSHITLKTAGAYWPGARYLARSGPDGADLALLDVISWERVAERFTHILIASGDHISAGEAAGLIARGCHVTVVSRYTGLSRQLAVAAGRQVIYLDAPDTTTHGPMTRRQDAA
jgi:hypothetical protein